MATLIEHSPKHFALAPRPVFSTTSELLGVLVDNPALSISLNIVTVVSKAQIVVTRTLFCCLRPTFDFNRQILAEWTLYSSPCCFTDELAILQNCKKKSLGRTAWVPFRQVRESSKCNFLLFFSLFVTTLTRKVFLAFFVSRQLRKLGFENHFRAIFPPFPQK